MEFLDKLNLKWADILKITGIALVLIIIAVFLFRIIGTSFTGLPSPSMNNGYSLGLSQNTASFGASGGMAKSNVMDSLGVAGLSERNVASSIIPPVGGYTTTGSDAENFEITDYNTTIETRHLDDTCKTISDLKPKDYVIFESARIYDHGCSYVFKVKAENVKEVLGIIKNLGPKEMSENTQTIKRIIDDFTSQEEILKNKKASIDDTLKNALVSYNEIADLATKTSDAGSLAKVIDSKINTIERLTQESISISAQLDTLARSKADQLDRMKYTYFNVSIYENKFVDAQSISDSWKEAVKKFITDVNSISQDITINLIGVILRLILYLIYIFLILIVVKYAWMFAKYLWKK